MCVRETEAVIVKHQLVVQLLIKDVREREEGGGQIRRRVRKNRKGQVPTPVQKINVKTQNLKKQKRAAEKKRCARLRVEGLKLSSG